MFGGVELETVFIPLTEAGSSLLQTSKFSMTSFYVTSFICSSVRATLTIFFYDNCTCSKFVKVQILFVCMDRRKQRKLVKVI